MLRFRGLLAALAVGTLLLVVAAAAYPLFISATASDLVDAQIEGGVITRYGAGVLYRADDINFRAQAPRGGPRGPLHERMGREFDSLVSGEPLLGPVVSTILGPEVNVSPEARANLVRPGRLIAATNALGHVQVISGHDGPGVWLPDLIAGALHVGPGDSISFRFQGGRPITVPVDGIYRSLYVGTLPGYWRVWDSFISRRCRDCTPPPQPILVDPDQLIRMSRALSVRTASFAWQAPINSAARLTLEQAQSIQRFAAALKMKISDPGTYLGRLFSCCHIYGPLGFRQLRLFRSYMPDVLHEVDQRIAVLQGPARLVQAAGLVVALAVIAAAGAFALSARRTEGGLLLARGVGPLSVAARTGLESVLPCVAGGVAGLSLTVSLLEVAEPTGPVAAGAWRTAIFDGAGAAAASILLLCLVAAARYTWESEHHRVRLAVLAHVPWEFGLLFLSYLVWQRLEAGGAFITDPSLDVRRPSPLLIVFPLLLLAGAGLLGARLFRAAARWVRAGSGRLPSPAYLAAHRIAGGPGLALALVASSALALGIFVQAEAMVRSLQATVDAKAKIYVGSDVEARIDYRNILPSRFGFPMTRVIRFPNAGVLSSDGTAFDLLAVDPATFPGAAYWNDDLSKVPLDQLTARLAGPAQRYLPIVVAGRLPAQISSIEFDQKRIPVHVVGTASAFPGMTSLRPLVVVDERSLLDAFDGYFNPLDTGAASTELWIKGDEAAIRRTLPDLGFTPGLVLTASQVKDIPYITAVIDTFVVLNVLGLVAALLVIAGMLMYLQARERSQVVSYGLSLRMGMTHGEHRRALVSELAAMLGSSYLVGTVLAVGVAALIVPRLDPIPVIPPEPIVVAPRMEMAAAAVAVAMAAWVGGWLTNRRARRVDLGEVMRLAE